MVARREADRTGRAFADVLSRAPLLVVVLVTACARPRSPAPPNDPVTAVFARASRDFSCPVEELHLAPCTCVGAVAVEGCGVDALYDYDLSDPASPPRLHFAWIRKR